MAFRLSLPKLDPESTLGLLRRAFGENFREHSVGYTIAIILMMIIAGTTSLYAWLVGDVVNKVFIDRNMNSLIFITISVLVISIIRGLGVYGSTVTLALIGNKITESMQRRLYDHLLTLGSDFYAKTHSSDLIARFSHAAKAAGDILNTVLTSFGRDLAMVVGLVAVMALKSPTMTLIVLLLGPIAFLALRNVVKRVREVSKLDFTGLTYIIAKTQETSQGLRIIKAFNLESIMRARMQDSIDNLQQRSDSLDRITALVSPIMETLAGIAIACVMLWAAFASINQGTEPGAFMSFIAAVLLAYEPAKRLANTRVQIERKVIGVRTAYNILDTEPSMDANPDGPDLAVSAGEVAFDNVSFGYRKSSPVLRELSLRAPAGKMTALVGPSGAGKSTIVNLIERFYDVASGTITIDGQDISKVRLASLRDHIALVSQDAVLFRASIRDNIRWGRPTATDEEVEDAARNALAYDFIMATKNGYNTMLDDAGASLSGGQKQRITIARAMLRDTPILLLDEATSSLDSESEHQVQIAFDRLMKGRTTIVIAHRLSTVLGADQICVVVDGRIVEQGRHAELLPAGKQYAQLYHLQFEKHTAASAAAKRLALT